MNAIDVNAFFIHLQVREQALWALGNIAGDGPKLRDTLLDMGVLSALLQLLQCAPKVCNVIPCQLMRCLVIVADHGAKHHMDDFQPLPRQETFPEL